MAISIFPSCKGVITPLCILSAALAATSAAWGQPRLPTVTVTATRFAEPAATLPLGVSVITADAIRGVGATTVNDAVMKLLGVVGRLDTSGGNNYSLDLRGFGSTSQSNQVVIVDGLRLNEADLSSAALASIPIATVEKIEVLRGTGAVLYGEGATGGVIIVTTKAGAGVQRNNRAELYLAGGSLGLRESRAAATLASGGFSVDVAASDRNSDGHRVNFASATDAVSAAAQWSNGWLRLGARSGRDAFRSGSPGALTAAQHAADPQQANSLNEFGAAQSNYAGVFAEAYRGAWQLAFDANQRTKDYDSLAFATPFAYRVDAANTSVRARHERTLADRPNVFVIGYDITRWERTILASLFTPVGTQSRAHSTAWYLKNDLTFPTTGTRLSLGHRREQLDKSEAASSSALDQQQNAWELGVSQPLGADVTAYARIGRSFRLANVDEFSFTNPNVPLQAQTSRDTELGARWRRGTSALELRWYRSALRNEIGYDPAGNGPFGPFGANVNFDPTLRQGLELEASHAVNATLDLRLNAALREARFTAGPYDGKNLMLVPRRTLAVRADWRPAPGHAISGGMVWVSGQSADFLNTCKIPGFATADLRYAFSWSNAELALGIANLTDRKYYTQAFACTAAGVPTSIYPEAGRTVTASVIYRF